MTYSIGSIIMLRKQVLHIQTTIRKGIRSPSAQTPGLLEQRRPETAPPRDINMSLACVTDRADIDR